jgi:nitrite reductase/ring-hydroxylating ferredoxin subunit
MAGNLRLICASDELIEAGMGVRFQVRHGGEEKPAFVVRFEGLARAYLNQCAHIPVELDFREGEFFDDSGLYLVCSTHGALYAPESGACMGGPCNGRGLTPLTVVEIDGRVYVKEEG